MQVVRKAVIPKSQSAQTTLFCFPGQLRPGATAARETIPERDDESSTQKCQPLIKSTITQHRQHSHKTRKLFAQNPKKKAEKDTEPPFLALRQIGQREQLQVPRRTRQIYPHTQCFSTYLSKHFI